MNKLLFIIENITYFIKNYFALCSRSIPHQIDQIHPIIINAVKNCTIPTKSVLTLNPPMKAITNVPHPGKKIFIINNITATTVSVEGISPANSL